MIHKSESFLVIGFVEFRSSYSVWYYVTCVMDMARMVLVS